MNHGWVINLHCEELNWEWALPVTRGRCGMTTPWKRCRSVGGINRLMFYLSIKWQFTPMRMYFHVTFWEPVIHKFHTSCLWTYQLFYHQRQSQVVCLYHCYKIAKQISKYHTMIPLDKDSVYPRLTQLEGGDCEFFSFGVQPVSKHWFYYSYYKRISSSLATNSHITCFRVDH